jgi:glutamyl-tRNA synthetase
MNGDYIRKMESCRYDKLCIESLNRAGVKTETFAPAYVSAALATCKEKIKLFSDLAPLCAFYFADEFDYEPEAVKKDFVPTNKPRLLTLREAFAQLEKFDVDALANTLKAVAARLGVKTGDIVHPTRLACTGRSIGPSLYHLLEVLGKERVLQRLDRALSKM